MRTAPKILAFAGSAREGSYNRMLLAVAVAGAQAAGAEVTTIDLHDFPLPVYDTDREATDGMPENAHKLKSLLAGHDGLLIASPEYNGSVPAVLKNVFDWTSRREGSEPPRACFEGTVAGIMSASPGALGGRQGLSHLSEILANLGVLVVPGGPSVSRAAAAFDPDGRIADKALERFVRSLGERVARLIAKLSVEGA
jgi:NAD(P)H-dependent FMN reductase